MTLSELRRFAQKHKLTRLSPYAYKSQDNQQRLVVIADDTGDTILIHEGRTDTGRWMWLSRGLLRDAKVMPDGLLAGLTERYSFIVRSNQ